MGHLPWLSEVFRALADPFRPRAPPARQSRSGQRRIEPRISALNVEKCTAPGGRGNALRFRGTHEGASTALAQPGVVCCVGRPEDHEENRAMISDEAD